jgi:hypothetical protein
LNLNSKKSYRVAKHLLAYREETQTEISNATRVSLGYVNEILQYLEDLNIVEINYGETRLTDYAKLLEKISMDRSFKKLITSTIRLPTSTIQETERTITKYCEKNNIEYALTGFSGLKHFYEYHISYPLIHIYIKNPEKIEGIEKGEGPTPIIILKPDRPDILTNVFKNNNMSICDKIQVIIDLYSSGLGRDAAIKYYRDLK